MEKDRRTKILVLGGVVLVFGLHYLGILEGVVLMMSALAGMVAVLGLLTEFRGIREGLAGLLDEIERRLQRDGTT